MYGGPLLYVALGAVGVVVLVRLAWRARRWRRSQRAVRRGRRAVAGEDAAAALLEQHGYAVAGRQVQARWSPCLDGVPLVVDLRVDYIVERDGQRFAAEVKTGELAPRLSHAATRRQLLEYRMALGVDGVLLVIPEQGAVHLIEFPDLVVREAAVLAPAARPVATLLVAVVTGIALGFCLATAW